MNAILKFFNCTKHHPPLPTNLRGNFERLKTLLLYSYLDLSVVSELILELIHELTKTDNSQSMETCKSFRKQLKHFIYELKVKMKKEVKLYLNF